MFVNFSRPLSASDAVKQYYNALSNSNEYSTKTQFDLIGGIGPICQRLNDIKDVFVKAGDTMNYSDCDVSMLLCLYKQDGSCLTIEGIVSVQGWHFGWD